MKTVSAFIRCLMIVLLVLFCLSFVEEVIFLHSSKDMDIGTIKREASKNTSSWADTATSILSDWGVNASSLVTSKSSSWDLTNFWLPTNLTSSEFSMSSWTDWGKWTGDFTEESEKNLTMAFFTPKVSIVIDSADDQDDEWLTRLAFAKMLQIEAHDKYGVDTEIVLVMPSATSKCFPNIENEARIVSDVTELKIMEAEQEKWLGDKSRLLDTSPDIWGDSLYLLKEHYRGKDARYAGDISLPFLRIDHVVPSLSEWRHVEEVVAFVKLKQECCRLTTTDNANQTVVHLESKLFVHPHQLLQVLPNHSSKDIVLVQFGASDSYADALIQAYKVQSLVGSSLEARYCLLQESSNFVGFGDSPLDVLAAMANTGAKTIVVVVEDLHEAKTFASSDRRSRIHMSTIAAALDRNDTLWEYSRNINKKGANDKSAWNDTSVDTSVSETTTLLENGTIPTKPVPMNIPNRNITIVIRLSGELGNHLGKLAYGYGFSWFLKEEYNISTNIVLQHQEKPKWVVGRKSMVSCFPNFRDSNFEAGNTAEFFERLNQQRAWLGDERHNLIYLDHDSACESEKRLQRIGLTLVEILSNVSDRPPEIPNNSTISLPFIFANRFANVGYINDRYYERIRELFKYDYGNSACCSVRSVPNETVFHARGFLAEMPKRGIRLGFEELSPNKTVTELLANHPGTSVTVLGRFEDSGLPYVDKLQEAGFQARLVMTETGEQSFCYLMSSQSEIIGTAESTFALWASYLGNASKSRFYGIRSPARIKRFGANSGSIAYNFSNPELRTRISFEMYNSEEQDQIEQEQQGRRIAFRGLMYRRQTSDYR